jgi:hypothetical protein
MTKLTVKKGSKKRLKSGKEMLRDAKKAGGRLKKAGHG